MKLCHVRSGCRGTIQYSLYKGFHGAKAIAGPVQLVSQWAKYNSPFILAFAFLLRDYSRFTPDLPKEVFPSTVENSCLAFIENVNLSLFPTERALLWDPVHSSPPIPGGESPALERGWKLKADSNIQNLLIDLNHFMYCYQLRLIRAQRRATIKTRQ